MKIKCLNCGASMVMVKEKYICSNYNKGLRFRCKDRFTITPEQIQEILQDHNVNKDEVSEFKINKDHHYQIVMRDGTIKGYDGATIIV